MLDVERQVRVLAFVEREIIYVSNVKYVTFNVLFSIVMFFY